MKTLSFLALVLGFSMLASAAQASTCSEVQRRIGDHAIFRHSGLGFGTSSTLVFTKTAEDWRGVDYVIEIVSGHPQIPNEKGSARIQSYGLYCTITSKDDVFFDKHYSFVIAIPNKKGECRVAGLPVSNLVSHDVQESFNNGGFCAYPLSMNPILSVIGNAILYPAPID